MMKRLTFGLIASLAGWCLADVSITDVTARQRYPWNGKVDITYAVSGCVPTGGGLQTQLKVMAVDQTTHVTNIATVLAGDVSLSEGPHAIVWDMGAQGLSLQSSNLVFYVSCEAGDSLLEYIDWRIGSNAITNGGARAYADACGVGGMTVTNIVNGIVASSNFVSALTGTVAPARLPVATTGEVGAVKGDGNTVAIAGDGTISVVGGGVGSDDNAVHYNSADGKTDAQKAQARANIGAARDVDCLTNRLDVLDLRRSTFGEYVRVNDLDSGCFNSAGEHVENANFSCKRVCVLGMAGKRIFVDSTAAGSAMSSWGLLDGSVVVFGAVSIRAYVTVPGNAKWLNYNYRNGTRRENDKVVVLDSGFVEDLYRKVGGTNASKSVYYYDDLEQGAFLTLSGNKAYASTKCCTVVDVSSKRGDRVYIRSSTSNTTLCKWKLSDGTFSVLENTNLDGYVTVPDNAVELEYNTNFDIGYHENALIDLGATYVEKSRMMTEDSVFSDFVGCNFCSFGDSTVVGYSWQPTLMRRLFIKTHTKCGVGGSRAGGDAATAMWRDERISTIPTNANLVVVACGANDFAQSEPLGEMKYENVDTNTFYGALNVISQKITARAPNARVFFTMFYCARWPGAVQGWPEDGMRNLIGLTCYDYRDAMKKFANDNGFGFVDVMQRAGINRHNVSEYYGHDGGWFHPNAEGGKKIGEAIFRGIVYE